MSDDQACLMALRLSDFARRRSAAESFRAGDSDRAEPLRRARASAPQASGAP